MCWNISSGWIKSGSKTGFLSDGEKRRACMLQSIQARFQFGSALQDRVVQLIFRKAGQLGDLLDGVLGREPFVHPRADKRERAYLLNSLLEQFRTTLYRHVLRNAVPATVTFLAMTVADIVAGSVVIEQVFAIPGLGRLLLSSISGRDYPVVQAVVVILAFWVVLVNLIADLINQRLDPRLRLS